MQTAQRKHLAKETEILQTEAARLGRTDGEIEIGKSILPKGYIDLGDNVIWLLSQLHRASDLAHNFTNPIIIPKGLAAERLVLDAHKRWMHASQNQSCLNFERRRLSEKILSLKRFSKCQTVVPACTTTVHAPIPKEHDYNWLLSVNNRGRTAVRQPFLSCSQPSGQD